MRDLSRRWVPVVLVLLTAVVVAAGRGPGRPSPRDDEVFLEASYLVRTQHLGTLDAVLRGAQDQYGWGGGLIERARTQGDIQTYALIPIWSRVGGFRTGRSPWGRPLYVESRRISLLSQLWFVVAVLILLWAVLPLGRGVAAAAALLLALGHPFRQGPALFDPWVMPLVTAAIGCWLRDRHRPAAGLAALATLIKPNYVFLLPAFLIASMVRPGLGDPTAREGRRPAALYGATSGAVIAVYLVLAAFHVIALKEYGHGVTSGYSPAVLAYSLVETVSFRYRAGTLQLRHHWPLYPWTAINVGVLAGFAAQAKRRVRLPRTAALLGALLIIPVVANFTVMASVGDYENGGHFRWINVAIIATAIALPLAYREAAQALGRYRAAAQPQALAAS